MPTPSSAGDQEGHPRRRRVVLRFKDPDKYYLLRAVPHEKRVRLYKVENGKRTTFTGSNLAIPVDTWHELKLVVRGTS